MAETIIQKNPIHVTNFTVTGFAVLQIPTTEDDPVVKLGASRPLETNDEHLKRTLSINDAWQTIDYGWVNNASGLVVSNTTPLNNPLSKDEQHAHVIELRQVGAQGVILLPVGWGQAFNLGQGCAFEVRSSSPSKLLILVIPR
jgi:hypothetical protein